MFASEPCNKVQSVEVVAIRMKTSEKVADDIDLNHVRRYWLSLHKTSKYAKDAYILKIKNIVQVLNKDVIFTVYEYQKRI